MVRPRRSRTARPFRADLAGAFPVLEAILVAVLVLTAIIFFTSLQRPTAGSEQGGIDLAKVSADTLSILRSRTFTVGGGTQTMTGWVTNVTAGDAATASAVDTFLRQVLPSGSRYSLRLDNGVGSLQVLPTGTPERPFEGRASAITILPNWHTYGNQTATLTVTPGQVVLASDASLYPLVDPASTTYRCFKSPSASSTTVDGGDADTTADTWASHWQSALQATSPTTNGKDTSATLGSAQQVPYNLPLGRWQVWGGADCASGATVYVNVVPPGTRSFSDATASASTTLTSTAAAFTPADVGRLVTCVSGCTLTPPVRITAVSGNQATLSSAVTVAAGNVVAVSPDSTFAPYGLELVVWFGA